MWRFEFAVVADLTANIFAACFLLFLIGWQSGTIGGVAVDRAPPQAYRVGEGAPLGGAERIAMLFRRSDETALRLDLRADHVLIMRPGRAALHVAAASIPDALSNAAGPAELYVFENDLYYPVLAELAARAMAYREIDVPEALRGPAAGPFGWSDGFLALIAARPDRAAFSAGLSRLLDAAASAASAAPRASAARPGPQVTAGIAGGAPLGERLAGLFGGWLALIMLAVGFGLAFFTEWRYPASGK